MKKAVLSNRIYLSVDDLLIKTLKQELYYTIPSKHPRALPEIIYDVVYINKHIVSIPIGRKDLIPLDYEIIDKRDTPKAEFPPFTPKLYESQQEVYDAVDDNCIINAQPGWGKTFTALAIAHKLGLKTLVIVHTISLRDQWAAEIKKVFGFTPDIIGSGKFGTSTPIVVSNIQTLRKHAEKIKHTFGTVLNDECHHIASSIFKSTLDLMSARYKIGLSATLGRSDGKSMLIKDYISYDNIYKPVVNNKIDPNVLIINSGIEFPEAPTWTDRVNRLTSNPAYAELVIEVAEKLSSEGHNVLVLSDRIQFLEICHELIDQETLLMVGSSKFGNDIISDRQKAHKQVGKDIKIILGTTSIYKEGIDIPQLSALVLAVPTKNKFMLEQIVGRITRPSAGKKKPIVVDIALDGFTARKQLEERINFYVLENNYKVINTDKITRAEIKS